LKAQSEAKAEGSIAEPIVWKAGLGKTKAEKEAGVELNYLGVLRSDEVTG
jgi:hypothetical protein